MKSANSSKLLGLEHDLPTTWEDVLALRRAQPPQLLSFAAYLDVLAKLPQVPSGALRTRKHPAGTKPFDL